MSTDKNSLFSQICERAEVWVLFLTLVLYIPFMGEPVLRTTGDEKVYVAQALEMQARASWFIQTLAEVPNYYKAPLHYIFLRIGYLIFGIHSLWSALWMNLLALALSSAILTRTLRLYWQDGNAALWVGLGLILAPGVFAHSFASQMEIELIAIYALALSSRIAWQANPTMFGWMSLWLIVGLASWLKSPVHSVLLGLGVWLSLVGSWRSHQNFFSRFTPFLAIVPGILLAACATLIPWVLDPKAFVETYILRETVGKGPNGVSIWQSLLPNLSYHMWPLAPLLIVSVLLGLSYGIRGRSLRGFKPLCGTGIAFAMALPTFAFFTWHPYRSEIYTLPALPAILMGTVGLGEALRKHSQKLWAWTSGFALVSSLLPSLLLLFLDRYLLSATNWWPQSFIYVLVMCVMSQILGLFLIFHKRWLSASPSLLLWIPAFLSFALVMKTLGEEDLKGLKQIAKAYPEETRFGFYNADRFVWSEWGLLNLSSGLSIQGLHDLASIRTWVIAGKPLIVSNDEERLRVEALAPELTFSLSNWSRWASHGLHSADKNPRIALQKRDLDLLRNTAYVMTPRESL